MDLKDLIEREIDQYLEWPTADKSHVTTVSAKLFAEHVARLYAGLQMHAHLNIMYASHNGVEENGQALQKAGGAEGKD